MTLFSRNAEQLHAFNGGPPDVWPLPDRVERLRTVVNHVHVVPFRYGSPRLIPTGAFPMERSYGVRVELRTVIFQPFLFRGWWFKNEQQIAGWDEATRTLVLGPAPHFEHEAAMLKEDDALRSLMICGLLAPATEAAR